MIKSIITLQISIKINLRFEKKIMKDVSEKVGYQVLELLGDDILDTSEYTINNRKVVVFDDLIIQNKINHYTDGRHHGISLIYLSQFYYDVPQKLRLNCSHMLLYVPQKLR